MQHRAFSGPLVGKTKATDVLTIQEAFDHRHWSMTLSVDPDLSHEAGPVLATIGS